VRTLPTPPPNFGNHPEPQQHLKKAERQALRVHSRILESNDAKAVAIEEGVSVARIYQIIKFGVRSGLFETPLRKKARIPTRDEVDEAIDRAHSVSDFRRRLGIGPQLVRAVLEMHHLTPEELSDRLRQNYSSRKTDRLMRRVRPYLLADSTMPSSYALVSAIGGRTLYAALIKEYGSYDAVRAAVRRYFIG
jgi:hypothetical protein